MAASNGPVPSWRSDRRVLRAYFAPPLTLKPGDERPYAAKIDALIVSGNRDAVMVKFADMSENSDPVRLAALSPELRRHFEAKYALPFLALKGALETNRGI